MWRNISGNGPSEAYCPGINIYLLFLPSEYHCRLSHNLCKRIMRGKCLTGIPDCRFGL